MYIQNDLSFESVVACILDISLNSFTNLPTAVDTCGSAVVTVVAAICCQLFSWGGSATGCGSVSADFSCSWNNW